MPESAKYNSRTADKLTWVQTTFYTLLPSIAPWVFVLSLVALSEFACGPNSIGYMLGFVLDNGWAFTIIALAPFPIGVAAMAWARKKLSSKPANINIAGVLLLISLPSALLFGLSALHTCENTPFFS